MSDPIGFIGAGQMGEPMVHRLVGAGHPVTVFARRPDVCARLRDGGATVVDTLAELASTNRIIVSCLFSDSQLREVALGPEGLLAHTVPEAILISHTTGTIATLQDLIAARPTTTVLDAPISGTAEDIAKGQLTVMIGGGSEAVEQAAPIVGAYADTVLRTGDLGSALNLKLVNNLLFAANAQLLGAAIVVAKGLAIEADRFLEALAACSADSKVAGYARGIGGIDKFTELAAPFLRKDVDAALKAAGEAGADLGLLYDVITGGPLPLAAAREAAQ